MKFEGLGWVHITASAGDARSKLVTMSAAGRAHLLDVQRALLPDYVDMLDGWSEQDIAALTALLFRLFGWLDDNRI